MRARIIVKANADSEKNSFMVRPLLIAVGPSGPPMKILIRPAAVDGLARIAKDNPCAAIEMSRRIRVISSITGFAEIGRPGHERESAD